MTTMDQIEGLTKKYADARSALGERVTALNDELTTTKRSHLRGIKSAVAAAARAHDELTEVLSASRDLFDKKKTHTFHGVRVGFQKGKGRIEWDDEEQVVKLIHRHFPEQVDALVKRTEKPVRSALANLSAGDLKRLGITVEDSGEVVFVKPVDGEIDKLVDALLADATAGDL